MMYHMQGDRVYLTSHSRRKRYGIDENTMGEVVRQLGFRVVCVFGGVGYIFPIGALYNCDRARGRAA
jgi:hypothetical protein